MKKNRYDLTTGSPLRKLLLVALPIMGIQFMQMTYNLTDMFWLGRLGSDAVAASGTAGMYMWLSAAFLMLGRMGAEIGVSQNVGRSDLKSAQKYASNAALLALFLGAVYGGVLVLFNKPLIRFFAIQEAHVAADAGTYLAIAAIGIPFSFLTAALSGTFNGAGNSRTPFLCNTVGIVLNILLDPLLIFGLNMGIVGAALATILSQAVVCAVALVAIYRSKSRPFENFRLFVEPEGKILKQILSWSIPIGAESLFFTFLSMITSRFTAAFGSDALAVTRVCSQIESLSWLVSGGFASAITAFIGQNFGANKWARIQHGFKVSVLSMGIWGIFVSILLFFAGGFFFSLFLNDPAALDLGSKVMRYLAVVQIWVCLESVASGCFKGIGKTVQPSLVSIIFNALRVPLCYVLSRTPLGVMGIFLGQIIGSAVRGIVCFLLYLRTNQKLPKIDEENDPVPSV